MWMRHIWSVRLNHGPSAPIHTCDERTSGERLRGMRDPFVLGLTKRCFMDPNCSETWAHGPTESFMLTSMQTSQDALASSWQQWRSPRRWTSGVGWKCQEWSQSEVFSLAMSSEVCGFLYPHAGCYVSRHARHAHPRANDFFNSRQQLHDVLMQLAQECELMWVGIVWIQMQHARYCEAFWR